jgi:hypothetical protein
MGSKTEIARTAKKERSKIVRSIPVSVTHNQFTYANTRTVTIGLVVIYGINRSVPFFWVMEAAKVSLPAITAAVAGNNLGKSDLAKQIDKEITGADETTNSQGGGKGQEEKPKTDLKPDSQTEQPATRPQSLDKKSGEVQASKSQRTPATGEPGEIKVIDYGEGKKTYREIGPHKKALKPRISEVGTKNNSFCPAKR